MQTIPKMNKMQLHLLEFFAQKEVSINEAEDIQRLIAKYYFDKAEKELEELMRTKSITQKDIDDLANLHLRTPYNKS